ncbi:MAG: VTT domain-containing protein, partial [Pseudomonadota bacterium]|nr:VTT domain-containing protein [Pseudomonadota bacterium]
VVALAGGYAFGFWLGAALTLFAEVAGCAIDFGWARLLGRRAALVFLQRRGGGRLARLDRYMTGRAFTATLTLRLLPVGNNLLLNLVAGVSGVAAGTFLLASAIGYVPQTIVFALAGAGAGLSNAVQSAVAALLLLLSVGLGVLLLKSGLVSRPGMPPDGD